MAVVADIDAPREVVCAITIRGAHRLVLLRLLLLLLDGDFKGAMSEGYSSVHEMPLCGAALALI